MNRTFLRSLLVLALLVSLCASVLIPSHRVAASTVYGSVSAPARDDPGPQNEQDRFLALGPNPVFIPLLMRQGGPPAAPSNLTAAAVSASGINLAWNDNSGDETGFQVERAPLNTTAFTRITTTAANVKSYQDRGLSAGTGYTYRVRAVNASGASAYAAAASATTLPNPPAAPTNLSASGTTATSTTLKWTDNAINETGYELERSVSGGAFTKIATLGASVTQRAVTDLTASTTYRFRVRAVNSGGVSAYSNEVQVQTPQAPLPVPAAPSNLTYSNLTTTTVTLSWADNANNETGFELEESVAGGAWVRIGTPAQLPANTRTADLTDLLPDTPHKYRIRAVNGAGASAYSNEVSFRTPAPAQTILRVVNNGTVDFIVSLKVNNVEYLTTWQQAIAPGASRDIPMNPGSVSITATTGYWDTQSNPPRRFEKYVFSFAGTIDPGTTETITIENPAIEGLLTNFSPKRAWTGDYWVGTSYGYATFCFYQNGRYRLYDKGMQVGYGNYVMVQYGAVTTYFNVVDSYNGETYQGKLDMTSGGARFFMDNGPSTWKQITYLMQGDTGTSQQCPTSAP